MAIIKLPKYDTKQINQAYKPRYTASVTSGLFESPSNPFSDANAPKSTSIFPGAQVDAVPLSETEKRIKSLESQVANLETRLKESGAEEEPERSAIEKFFNLPTDQVWWMDFFEVIDRPLQALKYGIAEGSLTSAIDAFSGNKEFMSGSDFLINTGIIEKEAINDQWTKLFFDLSVDIVADPLNYITPKAIGTFLGKIGILSTKNVVTKFDEVVKGLRATGLLKASKNTVDDAVRATRKLLNIADDVDIIADFNKLDDALKPRVIKSLADNGVYFADGFEDYIRRFGQTIDSTTGRVRYLADNIVSATTARRAAEEALGGAKNLTAMATVRGSDLLTGIGKAGGTTAQDVLQKLRNALPEITDSARRLEINNTIKALEDSIQAQKTAQKTFDVAEETVKRLEKELRKAGSAIEDAATKQIRDAFQKQVDGALDDVSAVVGNVRSNKVDLELFYRNKDGLYVKLNKTFEIKKGARFSGANPSLALVDADSILAAKNKVDNLKPGTKAHTNALNDLLEQEQIFANAGNQPVMRLVPGSKIRKKLGAEAADKINAKFAKMTQVLNKNGISFTDYVTAMRKYFDEVDKIVGNTPLKKLTQAQKDAIKALGKLEGIADLPEDVTRTFTLLNKSGDIAEETSDLVRAILDTEIAMNPNQVYGIIDEQGKLVMLTSDEYVKYSRNLELSIQAKTNKGTKEIQTKIYNTIDLSEIDDITAHNNLFIEKEILGQTTERVMKQTVEYTPGLIVKMLNGVQNASLPFISPAARLLADAVDGLTFLFNSTKGLPDDLVEILAKVPAEDIQKAKVSVKKVQNIVDDIVKQTKGKYEEKFIRETIGELIEQGWDGVTIAGRRMSVRETVKRWAMQYRKAGKAQFVNFANDIDFKNFADKIADVLKKEGLDPDFIKLTRKEGFTLVEFADGVTAKEVDEFVQNLGLVGDDVLDLGKGNLTTQQLAFAKEYNEPIQQIIEESVNQQNFLRQLGFDFSDGVLGTGSYFRHTINPKMLQFLKDKSPASIKKFLDAGTDMLRDRIYIGSISEINAAVKEMFGININLFSTDAAFNFADLVRVAGTKNEMQTVLKALMTAQDNMGKPLFEVIDDLEVVARNIKKNFKILNNSFKAEFPNLFKNVSVETQQMLLKYFDDLGFAEGSKVIAIQKSAFAALKRLDNAYVQLPEFIKNYDQFMKFWKTFALITPGYHTRNFFGNITNSFMAGMPLTVQGAYMFRTSNDFLSYRRVMNALYRGEDIGKFGDNVIAAFKRVDDYYRSGASQSHRGIRDLEIIKEGMRTAKGQTRNLAKKAGDKLLQFNYQAAEMMDDMQRYALYQWAYDTAGKSSRVKSAMKAGASANEIAALRRTEAYKRVSEALFDYSHLTPFEQEYMKRLFPFYTFFKNNLIFQAKNVFQRPAQFGKLYRGYKYYTESMTGFELEDLPNYMTDNLWLPMPYRVNKNNKEAIEWLRLNLPPSDFTEFVENPFARGVTSLTVPIKFFIEMGTGRDLFTGQQIREFPGQKDVYQSEGFLQQMRDSRGRLTLSSDPLVAKFLNDIGFRSLFNYGTSAIELIDFAAGNITRDDMLQRIVDALGLTRVQELDDIQIASLYQNIDRLRDLKDYYEQENDGKLPTLKDIAELAQQQETPQTGLLSIFN